MLNKHNLDIAQFATKEARYTMQAILVAPHETIVTDGHRLVRVSTPDIPAAQFPKPDDTFAASDSFKPFLLPAETAKAIAKAVPRKTIIEALSCIAVDGARTDANGTAHLAVTDLETFNPFTVRKPDGQFPNYIAVVPDPAKAELTISVNASYLAELARAAASFQKDGRRDPVLTMRFYGVDKALRMDCEKDGQQWSAVLMPIRHESDPEKVWDPNRKAPDAASLANQERERQFLADGSIGHVTLDPARLARTDAPAAIAA